MQAREIIIIDTGIANSGSLLNVFAKLGYSPRLSTDAAEIEVAQAVVLPGVGAFGAGMERLRSLDLIAPLRRRRCAQRPLLAVCLGMQLLFERSAETPGVEGLGFFPGTVEGFAPPTRTPQLGWNLVEASSECRFMRSGYAYFANSYCLREPPAGCAAARCVYAERFCAGFEEGSLLACQFHPELSGAWGIELLSRWCRAAFGEAADITTLQPTTAGDRGLCKRIIPCLDIKDGRVVKGTNFTGLRDAGDPGERAALYQAQGADEVVILDISATPEERKTSYQSVSRVRTQLTIPLTVGGGVRSLADVAALLNAGADKVALNTAAVSNPSLLQECAQRFGRQCTVLALDAAKNQALAGGYEVLVQSGRMRTGISALLWAERAENLGVGEIVLTSWDQDGTAKGYDLTLLRALRKVVTVPIIASGGAGCIDDFAVALDAGADAVLAASLFHFDHLSIQTLKDELKRRNFIVRT